MAVRRKPQPLQLAPDLPKTMTINVPVLGGLVTVRAMTVQEIRALRPAGFAFTIDQGVAYFLAVVQAGTVTPQLDRAKCLEVIERYGDGPLQRVLGAIMSVSGLRQQFAPFMPRNVVKSWFR